jgi:dsDNA-specific endonuclease/ATPase MutS2
MTRDTEDPDPIEIPIDGCLDLHAFRPNEIGELIPEYLEQCRLRGIFEVRIVHGKGTGALKRGVVSLLGSLTGITNFESGGAGRGQWGATIVHLNPTENRPIRKLDTKRES